MKRLITEPEGRFNQEYGEPSQGDDMKPDLETLHLSEAMTMAMKMHQACNCRHYHWTILGCNWTLIRDQICAILNKVARSVCP
jgi:hypothetical protein